MPRPLAGSASLPVLPAAGRASNTPTAAMMGKSYSQLLIHLEEERATLRSELQQEKAKWEEEAHFGTVLAELRGNPLAMHAELLWATCAAMSANSNKVLEPFPSFLLKKQQMRARAGQFDSGIARTEQRGRPAGDLTSSSTSEEAANKRLRTLAFLLRNLPPLSEMSAARSEGELVRKLDEKWRQLTGVKAAGPAMLHAVMQGRLDARRRIMQS